FRELFLIYYENVTVLPLNCRFVAQHIQGVGNYSAECQFKARPPPFWHYTRNLIPLSGLRVVIRPPWLPSATAALSCLHQNTYYQGDMDMPLTCSRGPQPAASEGRPIVVERPFRVHPL